MSVVSCDIASDFLLVKCGDIVVVEEVSSVVGAGKAAWWVGQIICIVGGARDPLANSLFQLVCIDTGAIRTINADAVKGVLRPRDLNS